MKKIFNVPVQWILEGSYEIHANSAEEASEIAMRLGIPERGDIINDGFRVKDDYIEEIEQ